MQLVILYIKPFFRLPPTVAGFTEQILMEIKVRCYSFCDILSELKM